MIIKREFKKKNNTMVVTYINTDFPDREYKTIADAKKSEVTVRGGNKL